MRSSSDASPTSNASVGEPLVSMSVAEMVAPVTTAPAGSQKRPTSSLVLSIIAVVMSTIASATSSCRLWPGPAAGPKERLLSV